MQTCQNVPALDGIAGYLNSFAHNTGNTKGQEILKAPLPGNIINFHST